MKKLAFLVSLIILSLSSGALYAAGSPTLSLQISGAQKVNPYFLCIYGVGCINLRAQDHSKQIPISSNTLENINKFVITNVTNFKTYAQNTSASCEATLGNNQHVAIKGHLVVKNNKPYIQDLRCTVA